MKFLHDLALVLLLAAPSCGGNGNAIQPPDNGGPPADGFGLQAVVEGLDFPVWLTSPPGDSRLFVVEKSGRVVIVENGAVLPAPFLDLRGQVSTGSEQGLLSLAFHPGYSANGRLFVNLTDPAGDPRVVEYRASPGDADRADPGSVRILLPIEQPFSNH